MTAHRILIVEDQPTVARDVSSQLVGCGYACAGTTSTGEDAVRLAGTLRPDLVLMDIQLAGEMDGIAAATQIRNQYQIPVVFLTAAFEGAELEHARRAESFGYIVQPVDIRVLQPVVEIALHKHRAEAALRRSETELLAIYDHAPLILCLLDDKARIIRANQAAAEFAGRPPGALNGTVGSDFISCLGALDDPEGCGYGPRCATCPLRMAVADTLRTGAPHAQVEVARNVPFEDGVREVNMLLSTARLDLDGNRRILMVLEDVTENRRLNEQLMRSQRMESIGTLASGIAHDLNNVLAPILMGLGMLRETLKDAPGREMAETMQLAANRGADIVRQLLTFARGVDGERVEIDPKHVVQEVARLARETFPRSIEITCDCGPDPGPILGDPAQIQQVLMNLCVNARDAMPHGGQLSILAGGSSSVPASALPTPRQAGGDYVVFTVRDTGTGMAPGVLERIFDPFFTTRPAGRGTGLGLPVALGIVERHGGAISVASASGAGTTFQVFLPAAGFARRNSTLQPAEAQLPQGHGETILVVDDEPGVRTVVNGMLAKAGYVPVLARDGGEALLRLSEYSDAIRLLITDVTMPGMDGLELIPRIRHALPGIPIVAMTGAGDDEIRTSARALGVDRTLAKPFSNAALLWAVHELLESQPAPRA